MDCNNNSYSAQDRYVTNFDVLTKDNVEVQLEKLKIIDDDYQSDEDNRDKVKLSGNGIDFRALKAGQDIEFEFDPDAGEDNYNWDDERDEPIDYEKIFHHRNMDMIYGANERDEENEDCANGDVKKSADTPFETLKKKMLDISPEPGTGMVTKRVLEPGCGLIIPVGSRVRIHYNAYFEMNDEPFDSTYLRNKSFEFKLGNGEVVIGLDVAVATMKKKEKSQFIFNPEYYCGKHGCPPRVPANTPVMFEIEIISYIEANALDTYDVTPDEQRKKLSLDQILQICNCLRELGNDNYKRKLYREASKRYRKAIYLLDNTSVKNEEEEVKWKGVMLKLYLNMSAVCIKQSKPKKCIYYCKLSLDFEPESVKSLYRYGKSLRILQDFDRSRKFLIRAYNLNPSDKDIAEEIQKLNDMVGKYNLLEKNLYRRMFNNSEQTKDETENELVLNEKTLLSETKDIILAKLNEFIKNDNLKTYTVQMDAYSLDIINFIISEAEKAKLSIRNIKGSTNIMQIMKNQ